MFTLARHSASHNTRIISLLKPHHVRWVAPQSTTSAPNPLSDKAEGSDLDAADKLDTLPSPFTRRSPGESPYRPSPARPGKAAADRGQDLSQRWVQLERTLRAKRGLVEEKADIEEEAGENIEEVKVGKDLGKQKDGTETFKGMVIPKKPEPPADDECCMSGCAICVYDLYEDSLETYDESVNTIQTKLHSLDVPESEWPESIRPRQSGESDATTARAGSGKSPVMSAFEELERKLAAKA